jgi:hypothetical protein
MFAAKKAIGPGNVTPIRTTPKIEVVVVVVVVATNNNIIMGNRIGNKTVTDINTTMMVLEKPSWGPMGVVPWGPIHWIYGYPTLELVLTSVGAWNGSQPTRSTRFQSRLA